MEARKRPHAGPLVVKQRVVAPVPPPLLNESVQRTDCGCSKKRERGGLIFEEIIDLSSPSPSSFGSDRSPLPLARLTGLFAAVRGEYRSDLNWCNVLFLLYTINRSF